MCEHQSDILPSDILNVALIGKKFLEMFNVISAAIEEKD